MTQYEAKPEEDKKRKKRIFLNSHENIPFHSALLTGAVFVVSIKHASLGDALASLIIAYTALRMTFYVCCSIGGVRTRELRPSRVTVQQALSSDQLEPADCHADPPTDAALLTDSFGINAPIPFRSLSFVFSMLTMFGALGVSIAAAFN